MTSFKKKILLVCYIFLVGILFTYALFPENDVKDYIENRVNQNLSGLRVDIGSLDLAFPLSLSLKAVTVSDDGDPLLSMKRLKISPKRLSLFFSEKKFSFKGNAYSGKISGTLALLPDGDMEISTEISSVDVSLIPAVISRTEGLKGILSGDVSLGITAMELSTGDGEIILSDFSFKPPVSLPDIERLTFRQIDSHVVLDRNNLEIVNCKLDGPDATGDVSGNIYLDAPVSRSDLDLEISATLLLSSTLSEINTYTFKVTGTFEAPKFALISL